MATQLELKTGPISATILLAISFLTAVSA